MECNCFDLCLRHEALQVLHLEVSLTAVEKVGPIVVLDTHFGPNCRNSKLLEAGAVDVLNVSLCPHTRGVQANHCAVLDYICRMCSTYVKEDLA